MFDKIKALFEFTSKNGIYLPSAYDAKVNGPSVSLLFAHLANAVALGGIVALMFNDLKTGVYSAMGYSGLMLAFYLLRTLSKVKFDAKSGGLELDSQEKDKEPNES